MGNISGNSILNSLAGFETNRKGLLGFWCLTALVSIATSSMAFSLNSAISAKILVAKKGRTAVPHKVTEYIRIYYASTLDEQIGGASNV
ncbi:MAG: hypothetical protein JKX94_11055 [Sneathiella sp.]|nr:hypothetical protein [Sneathiella sp.]